MLHFAQRHLDRQNGRLLGTLMSRKLICDFKRDRSGVRLQANDINAKPSNLSLKCQLGWHANKLSAIVTKG